MSRPPFTTEMMYERNPDMSPGQESEGVRAKYLFLCMEHGEYEQRLKDHTAGRRCPKCSKNAPPTREEMYKRFPDLMSGQDYKNAQAKYLFLCETHGKYAQTWSNHSQGTGCPICARFAPCITPPQLPSPAIIEKLTALGIRPKFEFLNVDGNVLIA